MEAGYVGVNEKDKTFWLNERLHNITMSVRCSLVNQEKLSACWHYIFSRILHHEAVVHCVIFQPGNCTAFIKWIHSAEIYWHPSDISDLPPSRVNEESPAKALIKMIVSHHEWHTAYLCIFNDSTRKNTVTVNPTRYYVSLHIRKLLLQYDM